MAFILFCIQSYLKALALISPKLAGRRAYKIFSTPRTRRSIPPWAESVMANADTVELSVEGKAVRAYRWANEGRPRILLAHGWESRAARLAAWVEPLLDAGFEVVAYDAPAHGESEGKQTNPKEMVLTMAELARRVGPIDGCVGHSLGGFSVLMAASALEKPGFEDVEPDLFRFQRIVAVAGAETGVDAMTMFCHALGLGARFVPLVVGAAGEEAGASISSFDIHRTFPEHPIPTLWMHDLEDADVSFESAQRVAETCPHVTLEQVEGLGHQKIVRDPDIVRRGVEFLSPMT